MTPAARMTSAEYRDVLAKASVAKASRHHERKRRAAPRRTPEEDLQRTCVEWLGLHAPRHPLLARAIHVPNGGKRPRGEAGRLKALGVKKGVPDILLPLPCPKTGWSGLAIELKSATGALTDEQRDWLMEFAAANYVAGTARTFYEFRNHIETYLGEVLS